MDTRDILIPTSDGLWLAGTVYGPTGSANGMCAFIAPATGKPQDQYTHYARYLTNRGWHVITFDYRGIGRSAHADPTGARLTMQAWGEFDIAAVIRWARSELRPSRLVAITHSIGGQVIAF